MKVCVPTVLRKHTAGESEVIVAGATVREAIDDLVQQHPGMREGLFDSSDQLVRFMGVFVNDRNIRDLEGESTQVSDHDEILLVPAIAGG